MALEAATYISQLVLTNPTGADKKSQGDDQIRLVKAVLQSTFPTASRAFNLAEWAEKSSGALIKDANYTMLATDDGKAIYFDCTAGSRTYDLLDIASAPAGTIVFITRDKTTVANTLTIDGSGGELINGETTVVVRAGESGFLCKLNAAGNEWAFFYTRTRQDFLFALSVVLAAAGDAAVFESTLASAARAPDVVAYRNRSGVNDDFVGSFVLRGKNTTGTVKDLARARGKWINVAAASETAYLLLSALKANVETDEVTIGDGIALGAATGGQPGTGKANATAYKINGVELANGILQHLPQSSAAQLALATRTIPGDDTAPLSSEGTEAFSQAVTPKVATSKMRVHGVLSIGCNGASAGAVVTVFKGTTLVAVFPNDNVSTANNSIPFDFTEVSGDLSARTYSVRFGSASGTIGLNVDGGSGGDYGNLVTSSFNVTESLA